MKTIIGKVVLLGMQGVGKTSVAKRYIDKCHDLKTVSPTIGASFFTGRIQLENETVVKLQIWDTSGQERFKAMAPMFYRNANAAIILYDITQQESFESMKRWVVELQKHVETNMVLCVVGNKIDLESTRQVSRDEAIHYAQSIGANHYDSSAKENQGIDQVFHNIAVGLSRLAGGDHTGSLQIYEGSEVDLAYMNGGIVCVGKIEEVKPSIHNVAHGSIAGWRCC